MGPSDRTEVTKALKLDCGGGKRITFTTNPAQTGRLWYVNYTSIKWGLWVFCFVFLKDFCDGLNVECTPKVGK